MTPRSSPNRPRPTSAARRSTAEPAQGTEDAGDEAHRVVGARAYLSDQDFEAYG